MNTFRVNVPTLAEERAFQDGLYILGWQIEDLLLRLRQSGVKTEKLGNRCIDAQRLAGFLGSSIAPETAASRYRILAEVLDKMVRACAAIMLDEETADERAMSRHLVAHCHGHSALDKPGPTLPRA